MIGTTLGSYHVLSKLGAGGMGEVYRARDSKLGRDVAIKVLPERFQSDRDRLARFDREARALAAVNHSNIAAIYGVAEERGTTALVLELVEGKTLAERLRRGPIPVPEAIDVAKQIAAGIDAAHGNEIIHRDLKPSNIKITPRGVVKILDFGLAKAMEDVVVPGASTVSVEATRDGAIVGTAAYMSPEQARGQKIDTRTDIWAFGCVLYEMLTGKQAFAGATISDSIAAILDRDPDWSVLPPETPPAVRRLLQRCLEFMSLTGEPSITLCNDDCSLGFGPARVQAPVIQWSHDGKLPSLSLQYFGLRTPRTVFLPYRSDLPLDRQYPKGMTTEGELVKNPGAKVINEGNVFPAGGSDYLVWKLATQSNLYQVSLPH